MARSRPPDLLRVELTFRGDLSNTDVLPDGTRIIFGAETTSEQGRGQIRDVIIYPDGSVHLGAAQ
jgi:glucose/arabinose dehydrogenase